MKKEYLDSKIEYRTDDGNYLGHIAYEEHQDYLSAVSTVVDKEARGQGIARKLVLDLIELAQQKNKQVKPVCSYVVDFFDKNEDYQDILFKD